MLFLAPLLLSQASVPTSDFTREWVVREVIPGGASPVSGFERRRFYAKAPGDLDYDGRNDFLLQFEDSSLSGGYPWNGLHWIQGSASVIQELVRVRYDEPYSFGGPFTNVALLNSPNGILRAINGPGGLLRTITAQNIPLATAQRQYEQILRVRDLNADGFDDLFVHAPINGYAFEAMVDGASLTEVWSVIGGIESGQCVVSPYASRQFSDYNGDGHSDFLSGYPIWLGSSIEARIRALSGPDGRLLWSWSMAPTAADFGVAIAPDITGDSVDEVAFILPTHLAFQNMICGLLDGATGHLLWSKDTVDFDLLPPIPGYVMRAIHWPVFVTDSPGQQGEYDVVLLGEFEDPNSVGPDLRQFLHADARTGSILGWADEPLNVEPWFPDPFNDILQPRTALGDIDRDGLSEVAVPCVAWSQDLPGTTGYLPWHMSILGQRTLLQPASARPGDSLDYTIAIPGAPGHDYLLLLSLGFDRGGGVLLDGWKSHLVADAAFQATRGGRYSGRLDARGVGTERVTLPPSLALSGKTLYAKAIVLKPGSASEVWTMSSLGVTQIR